MYTYTSLYYLGSGHCGECDAPVSSTTSPPSPGPSPFTCVATEQASDETQQEEPPMCKSKCRDCHANARKTVHFCFYDIHAQANTCSLQTHKWMYPAVCVRWHDSTVCILIYTLHEPRHASARTRPAQEQIGILVNVRRDYKSIRGDIRGELIIQKSMMASFPIDLKRISPTYLQANLSSNIRFFLRVCCHVRDCVYIHSFQMRSQFFFEYTQDYVNIKMFWFCP